MQQTANFNIGTWKMINIHYCQLYLSFVHSYLMIVFSIDCSNSTDAILKLRSYLTKQRICLLNSLRLIFLPSARARTQYSPCFIRFSKWELLDIPPEEKWNACARWFLYCTANRMHCRAEIAWEAAIVSTLGCLYFRNERRSSVPTFASEEPAIFTHPS